MEIKEFIELYKENKSDALKQIHIKTYLPFLTKRQLVNLVLENILIDKDGVYVYNAMDKYMSYTLVALTTYTDLVFSTNDQEYYEEYDALVISGALGEIFGKIGDDYHVFLRFFEESFQTELDQKNSIQLQASRVLSSIESAIDLAIDTLDSKKVQAAIKLFAEKINKKK